MKSYHDIVGDGGSDVLEQVRAQEESVARSLAGVRNLVAIRLRELGSTPPDSSWKETFHEFEPEDPTRCEESSGSGEEPKTPRMRALEVLEVGPRASQDEIRSAYLRLCKKYHPDRFSNDDAKSQGANELLTEINLAYQILREDS